MSTGVENFTEILGECAGGTLNGRANVLTNSEVLVRELGTRVQREEEKE